MAELSSSPRPERRDIIVAEAVRLFNANGFADTRLEDIGERLGATKTSISYHFKSKDGLLLEAYDRALAFSEDALVKAEQRPTAREALLCWVEQHAIAHAHALAGSSRPLAILSEFPELVDEGMHPLKVRYECVATKCREMLERGKRDGSIGVQSIEAAQFLVSNVMQWLPRWLGEVRPADYESAIEGLTDLLANGLAADPGRIPATSINRSADRDVDAVFDREARNRLKREAFLRTGSRALNRTGYRRLSLNEVAAELGVTRGAFYYHIADKDALLLGCFERSCNLIETSQTLGRKSDIPGLDALERSLRWLFERQVSNLDPLIRLNLLAALDKKNRILIEAKLRKLQSEFADMVATGMVDGSIRVIDIAVAERLIMGVLFISGQRQLSAGARDDGETTERPSFSANEYFEILFYGLSGRPNDAGR